MRISRRLLVTTVGLVSAVGVFVINCDDKPTRPKPPEEPKEYSFYFLDAFSAQCFEYSPTAGIVDSFLTPFTGSYEIQYATLSADGVTMYVTTQSALYSLDVSTLDTARIFDTDRRVIASPDGRYLILLEYPLQVLSTQDYSLVFTDTLGVFDGTFSADGQTFYGCGHSGSGFVYELSMGGSFVTSASWLTYRVPTTLGVSPDGAKWYLYSIDTQHQCTYSFDVYDTLADSIIFSVPVVPGLGSLAVSPEGRFVYFTNPGYGMMPNPDCPEPPNEITVFDASKNQLYLKISTAATYGDLGFQYLNIGSLESTPDGKWILGLSVHTGFVLIDANAAQITQFEALGDLLFDHYLFSPMAQTGL